jgi:hypothetical protein
MDPSNVAILAYRAPGRENHIRQRHRCLVMHDQVEESSGESSLSCTGFLVRDTVPLLEEVTVGFSRFVPGRRSALMEAGTHFRGVMTRSRYSFPSTALQSMIPPAVPGVFKTPQRRLPSLSRGLAPSYLAFPPSALLSCDIPRGSIDLFVHPRSHVYLHIWSRKCIPRQEWSVS